jgi:hypothetical protein
VLCSNADVGTAFVFDGADDNAVCDAVLFKPWVSVVKLEIVIVIVGREVSSAVLVASSGS